MPETQTRDHAALVWLLMGPIDPEDFERDRWQDDGGPLAPDEEA
jgi:hypothetical protein